MMYSRKEINIPELVFQLKCNQRGDIEGSHLNHAQRRVERVVNMLFLKAPPLIKFVYLVLEPFRQKIKPI